MYMYEPKRLFRSKGMPLGRYIRIEERHEHLQEMEHLLQSFMPGGISLFLSSTAQHSTTTHPNSLEKNRAFVIAWVVAVNKSKPGSGLCLPRSN